MAVRYLAVLVLMSWAAVLVAIASSPDRKARGSLPLAAVGSSLALAVWVLA